MSDDRCISACYEKERLGIKQGLCKTCANERLQSAREALAEERDIRARLEKDNLRLRSALIGLVGVSEREELEQLESVMRLMPGPAADKAASIDAIHALLAV